MYRIQQCVPFKDLPDSLFEEVDSLNRKRLEKSLPIKPSALLSCEVEVTNKVLKLFEEQTGFDYLYAYEYSYAGHYGDMVLTDNKGNFLVIECKFLNFSSKGEKNRRKKRKLEQQVHGYTRLFHNFATKCLPDWKSITGLGFVNSQCYTNIEIGRAHV